MFCWVFLVGWWCVFVGCVVVFVFGCFVVGFGFFGVGLVFLVFFVVVLGVVVVFVGGFVFVVGLVGGGFLFLGVCVGLFVCGPTPTPNNPNPNVPAELPQTGANAVSTILGLTSMVTAFGYYFASRKAAKF